MYLRFNVFLAERDTYPHHMVIDVFLAEGEKQCRLGQRPKGFTIRRALERLDSCVRDFGQFESGLTLLETPGDQGPVRTGFNMIHYGVTIGCTDCECGGTSGGF